VLDEIAMQSLRMDDESQEGEEEDPFNSKRMSFEVNTHSSYMIILTF